MSIINGTERPLEAVSHGELRKVRPGVYGGHSGSSGAHTERTSYNNHILRREDMFSDLFSATTSLDQHLSYLLAN